MGKNTGLIGIMDRLILYWISLLKHVFNYNLVQKISMLEMLYIERKFDSPIN